MASGGVVGVGEELEDDKLYINHEIGSNIFRSSRKKFDYLKKKRIIFVYIRESTAINRILA